MDTLTKTPRPSWPTRQPSPWDYDTSALPEDTSYLDGLRTHIERTVATGRDF